MYICTYVNPQWYVWINYVCASLMAQTVKNLPIMQDTQVQSLGG